MQASTPVSRAPADTHEAERDLQHRVGRFALFVFCVAGPMFVVARVLDLLKPAGLTLHDFLQPARIPFVVGLVLLFVVWRRSRGGPIARPMLEAMDASVTVVVCAAWAMLGWGGGSGYPSALALILAMTHTLVARSVVVPSSFRRTLVVSLVATLPTVAVIAAFGSDFDPHATLDRVRYFVVFTIMWCLAATAISAVNSRTLFGLRKQIREAGKLGQYTLEEKIGEGGMGVVHRATHALLRRPAAIKLLLAGRANAADLDRFEREVQQTSRLAHPNTISIFDYGRSAEGVFYYVMEYLDGMDLERLVVAEGPLDAPRAVHILTQVAGALSEAHALGLIHRDIKPANIILTDRADEPDVVKVVDFGLVKTLDAATGESLTGNAIVGTPQFLAPEAITAPSTIDARSDLYAVGAVAYFLLTGKNVFEAPTIMALCSMHVLDPPLAPSIRLGRPIAADLEAIVLACLAKQREQRPASAAALRDSLLGCEDAARYDRAAMQAWWRSRGSTLRESARRRGPPMLGEASTMAVDLRRRDLPTARG